MLTINEKKLIADALNGVGMMILADPNYLRLMAGDGGALKDAAVIGQDEQGRVVLTGSTVCSGLEHEIYDAIRLNRLDEKWGVSGGGLIHKIREMTPEGREKLVRFIGELWDQPAEKLNDGTFESRLEAWQE